MPWCIQSLWWTNSLNILDNLAQLSRLQSTKFTMRYYFTNQNWYIRYLRRSLKYCFKYLTFYKLSCSFAFYTLFTTWSSSLNMHALMSFRLIISMSTYITVTIHCRLACGLPLHDTCVENMCGSHMITSSYDIVHNMMSS